MTVMPYKSYGIVVCCHGHFHIWGQLGGAITPLQARWRPQISLPSHHHRLIIIFGKVQLANRYTGGIWRKDQTIFTASP